MESITAAVDLVDRNAPLAMLSIWKRPNRVVAVRRGQPLSIGHAESGLYIASLATGIPGNVRDLKDNQAVRFEIAKGEINANVHAVASFTGSTGPNIRRTAWGDSRDVPTVKVGSRVTARNDVPRGTLFGGDLDGDDEWNDDDQAREDAQRREWERLRDARNG
jgi:hypothetical protein